MPSAGPGEIKISLPSGTYIVPITDVYSDFYVKDGDSGEPALVSSIDAASLFAAQRAFSHTFSFFEGNAISQTISQWNGLISDVLSVTALENINSSLGNLLGITLGSYVNPGLALGALDDLLFDLVSDFTTDGALLVLYTLALRDASTLMQISQAEFLDLKEKFQSGSSIGFDEISYVVNSELTAHSMGAAIASEVAKLTDLNSDWSDDLLAFATSLGSTIVSLFDPGSFADNAMEAYGAISDLSELASQLAGIQSAFREGVIQFPSLTANGLNGIADALVGAEYIDTAISTNIIPSSNWSYGVVITDAKSGEDYRFSHTVDLTLNFSLADDRVITTYNGTPRLVFFQNYYPSSSAYGVHNVTILGSMYDDQLLGYMYDNTIFGGSGDDYITGEDGDDKLFGGVGDDQLWANGGDDLVEGGSGNDTMAGYEGTDTLSGGIGDDGIFGGDGNDSISGGDGHDAIWGDAGNDSIEGGSDYDEIWGGDGSDEISGGEGDDFIEGNGGNDLIRGGDGNDLLMDASGNETDASGGNTVEGGPGNDIIISGLGIDYLSGGPGDDFYRVYDDQDIIVEIADGGEDTIGSEVDYELPEYVENLFVYGSAQGTGNDLDNAIDAYDVEGAASANGLWGGSGNDTLHGGPGDDTLHGDSGNDLLFGEADNDILIGGDGVDFMIGGNGDDTYFVDSMAEAVLENAAAGNDTLVTPFDAYIDFYANLENLTLAAGAGDLYGVGNILANIITGNTGSNLLLGGGGNDTLNGGAGVDSLFGEAGDDALYGDSGIDYLVGGIGNDALDGGADADAIYGEDGNDTLGGGTGFVTDILVGGSGNDKLYATSGLNDYDLIDGGSGDDNYYVDTGADLTFEAVGGGIDTVYADVSNVPNAGVYLYANLENLVLIGTTAFGVGNELANTLTGSASANWLLGGAGNDTLDGKAGNDVLFGEGGFDSFVFQLGTGGDVIGDFTHGEDEIDLSAYDFASFEALQTTFIQNGNVGAINLGNGDFIVLHNVTMANLDGDDFVL